MILFSNEEVSSCVWKFNGQLLYSIPSSRSPPVALIYTGCTETSADDDDAVLAMDEAADEQRLLEEFERELQTLKHRDQVAAQRENIQTALHAQLENIIEEVPFTW